MPLFKSFAYLREKNLRIIEKPTEFFLKWENVQEENHHQVKYKQEERSVDTSQTPSPDSSPHGIPPGPEGAAPSPQDRRRESTLNPSTRYLLKTILEKKVLHIRSKL